MKASSVVRYLTKPRRRHLLGASCRKLLHCRSFSSVGTPDATVPPIGAIPVTKVQPPRPIFPWRHENLDKSLPRLIPGTKEFEMASTAGLATDSRVNDALFAWHLLGVKFLDAFIFKNWKKDLEDNTMYAFEVGMSQMLSKIFGVPSKKFDGDGTIQFSYPLENGDDSSVDEAKFDRSDLTQMFDPSLIKLFQSAHESGKNQLRIVLETRPIASGFYRFYTLPFFLREEIERNPEIFRITSIGSNEEKQNLYSDHIAEKLRFQGYVETTVAAEVFMVCEEKFQVLDAETGVVLQGQEGVPVTQNVGHVVTFETTGRVSGDYPYLQKPDNWRIIDIDDLVSVKKWYHIP